MWRHCAYFRSLQDFGSVEPARPYWRHRGSSLLLNAFLHIREIWAGPPSLPADMQAQVNKAIDKGVNALLMSMNQWGNWAPEDKHLVGYSALPGLTLLECGVPATDPRVKKAANFVRKMAARPHGNL